MKKIILFILAIICSVKMVAQGDFNPDNPPNPYPPTLDGYRLTTEVVPYGAGQLSASANGSYQPGQEVSLRAYNNEGYKFVGWIQDEQTLSAQSSMTYTMPNEPVRLVALFVYSPNSPANPEMPDSTGGTTPPPVDPDEFDPNSPSNPGANSFDATTGLVIVDDFVPGYLSTAINNTIVGYSSADVYQIIVQGVLNSNDFGVANKYANCISIDFSRCGMLKEVPSYTYNGNKNLEQIILPRSVERIGANAFNGASRLTQITCYATTPPTLGDKALYSLPSTTVIYVPENSIDKYQAADGWKDYNIQAARKQDDADLIVSAVHSTQEKCIPGEEMSVSWQVDNIGSTDTHTGWRELVYLQSGEDKSVLLHTAYYTGQLQAQGSVQRNAVFVLPDILGIDGNSKILITVVPGANTGESPDAQANNSTLSDREILVEKCLYLTLPSNRYDENRGKVALSLKRSGFWNRTEEFRISVSDDSRVTAPASVKVEKGNSAASFYVTIGDNSDLDVDSVAVIQVDGCGYEPFTDTLVIVDNDLRPMSVSTDKVEYHEGEVMRLSIETDKRVVKDTPVSLSIEQTKRFEMIPKALIPRGEKMVIVDIPVIDDNIPASETSVEISASASGFETATTMIVLKDDDVPAIDMSLVPSTIAEDAGANALYATITRTGVTDNRVTLKLSDDGHGDIFYTPTIVMEQNVTEKTVVIGVRDNADNEGEREVNLTAAVYIQSCDCNPTGSQQSSISRKITITDNDGPTLTLVANRATVLEGDKQGVTFTLSRNNDITEALPVQISCDDTDISLPRQITIPPGQRSATFNMFVDKNDVQEGNRVVNIKAACSGYNPGNTYVLVTDCTLPDMVVSSVKLKQDSVVVGESVDIMVELSNEGAAPIPARSTVKVIVANETLTLTVPDAVPVGGKVQQPLSFVAPKAIGTYDIKIHCNEKSEFTELQHQNNIFAKQFYVVSPYSYVLSVEKQAYNQGDVVKLIGQVHSNANYPVAGVKVEPYVMSFGTRTSLTANTDADGVFTLEYELPQGIGGNYGFGVCMPGEQSESIYASASVYGLVRSSASYLKNYMYVDEPYKCQISLMNISDLPLHNIQAKVSDEDNRYTIETKPIEVIDGNAMAMLEMTITPHSISTSESWERMNVLLTSDEGAELRFVLYNYTNVRKALLKCQSGHINTTITKGKKRIIPVVLTNMGMGETGKITVDLPSTQKFVSMSSAETIPSIGYGDSIMLNLEFDPANLDINVIQKGKIAINCENADGLLLNYSIKVVGEEKGSLAVRVQDEYTVYGNASGEHPYVKGAQVRIKDYNTGAVLYEGTTGDDGKALFQDIDEGYYTVYVTAPKHDSYTQHVFVNPGQTTEHMATLSYDAISVSWDVQEVAVEDRYEIKTELVYETQVPQPVLVLEMPNEIDLNKVLDGGSLLFNIIVVNKGLITAQNVCISLPQAEGFRFVPLTEYSGFELAAGQSRVIPVYVCLDKETKQEAQGMSRASRKSGVSCSGETYLGWEWPCGDDSNYAWLANCVKFMLRTCEPDPNSESKPSHTEKTEPVTCPNPPDRELGEVNIWRPTGTTSQVDLHAVYQLTCKISCALVCVAVDPIGGALGAAGVKTQSKTVCYGDANMQDKSSLLSAVSTDTNRERLNLFLINLNKMIKRFKKFKRFIDKAQERLNVVKCIYNSIKNDYSARSAVKSDHVSSLWQSYERKIKLMDFMDSICSSYEAYIVNSPALLADKETSDTVVTAIIQVNDEINQKYADGLLYNQTIEQLISEFAPLMPQGLTVWHDFDLRKHVERIVNSYRFHDGESLAQEDILDIELLRRMAYDSDSCATEIEKMGFVDLTELYKSANEDAQALYKAQGSTCATVKLQISQEMVLTRQAFHGTLTIENNDEGELTDISTMITATDEFGKIASSREMEIHLLRTEGFESDGDKWKLSPGASGTAVYEFIPTRYAAQDHDVTYEFGGALYFHDGNEDQVRSLYPCKLVVRPTPVLNLTYFVQRDLYGDNPLTPDVVEPVVPAEFTVLISNNGNGDAEQVRMLTKQPQVIENDKGLLVDFSIISSFLNGEQANLSFGEEIATEFGRIPAGTSSYATWQLTSSLLGHMREYDISYTHLTSFGNPDLSLLENVSIHELIHSVNARIGNKTYRAWVTNDEMDVQDLPDRIYFSNGTDQRLHALTNAAIMERVDDTKWRITIDVPTSEWYYTSMLHPLNNGAKVSRIVNEDNGQELDIQNVWVTEYVMHDEANPVQEYRVHMVDLAPKAGKLHYLVEFEPMPDVMLAVTDITPKIDITEVQTSPVDHFVVTFNKDIDIATFTREDIIVRHEGRILNESLDIVPLDNRTFSIATSSLSANGYYCLTVNTRNITDSDGFAGNEGLSVNWLLYNEGNIDIKVRVEPQEAGEAKLLNSPSHGSTAHFITSANPGYEFIGWMVNGSMVSTESSYDCVADYGMDVIAKYKKKTYMLIVDASATNGVLTGASSGIYEYGEQLTLEAHANDGYVFSHWIINGVQAGSDSVLDLIIEQDLTVSAVFTSTTGIDAISSHAVRKGIYTISGILISNIVDKRIIESLPSGIYVINGVKYVVK